MAAKVSLVDGYQLEGDTIVAKPRVATHPHGVNVRCRRSRSLSNGFSAFAGALNVLRLVHRLGVAEVLETCGIHQQGYGALDLFCAYVLRAFGVGTASALQLAKRLKEDPIGQCFTGQPDRSTFDRFVKRGRFQWRKALRLLCCRIARSRTVGEGVLVIDDTILERTGKRMEGRRKLYDASKEKYVWGHNAVGAVYSAGGWSVPFDIALTERQLGETKHQIALAMVEAAKALGLKIDWIVFDSWYFHSLDFIQAVAKCTFNWVSRTKSDRIFEVNGERLSAADIAQRAQSGTWRRHTKFRGVHYQTVRATLPDYGPVTLVTLKAPDDDGSPVVLVSSDPKAHGQRVVRLYKQRWAIETVWRNGKQRMGLGDCHHRTLHAAESHLAIVMVAYGMAELLRVGMPPELAVETLGELIDDVIATPARVERQGETVTVFFIRRPELAHAAEQLKSRLPGRKRRSDAVA